MAKLRRERLQTYARFRQRLDLLTAATEDKRVAAFEAHDRLTLTSLGDHDLGDFSLREDMVAALFPDVDALGRMGRELRRAGGAR